jgi:hypothetical protein
MGASPVSFVADKLADKIAGSRPQASHVRLPHRQERPNDRGKEPGVPRKFEHRQLGGPSANSTAVQVTRTRTATSDDTSEQGITTNTTIGYAHPHLARIAAKLRGTALGKLPEELKRLVMTLAEREGCRNGNEGSSGRPGA